MRNVVLYATDTMADWEYAYVTAGLAMANEQHPGSWQLQVLGDDLEQVTTTGGLRLATDGSLDAVDLENTALLVLPGGDTWATGHERVLELASTLVDRGTPVAAICGATLGLARVGLLDQRAHTSNAPEFLASSGYAGGAHFSENRVVDADGLITAPGTAPVDFAAAIFRRLEVLPSDIVDAWHGLYTTGERRFYDALVGAEG